MSREQVDLIFELAQQSIDERFLARAEELSVNSVRMPVIAATDMIGSLLAAFSEHHCDFGAVLPIARLLREKVDWRGLRAQFGSQPMPDAFLYLLERLDVIPARPGVAAFEQAAYEQGAQEGASRRD